MSEKFTKTYPCNCGEGEIVVKGVRVTGMGPNQSQPIEGIASIKPCRICGSTMNSKGIELNKKKRN